MLYNLSAPLYVNTDQDPACAWNTLTWKTLSNMILRFWGMDKAMYSNDEDY
jgi:hypothetical protein